MPLLMIGKSVEIVESTLTIGIEFSLSATDSET